MDLDRSRERGEAAIGAGDEVLTTDGLREPHDTLGHQLGVFDEHRRLRDGAGNQHGSLGQLDRFPDAPLVLVPRVRRLERVSAGPDRQHDVHEVLQLEVVDAGTDVDAVAGVPANPVPWESPQGMVQGFHAHRRPPADLVHAQLRMRHVMGRQVRVVDLHEESGVDDRLVLLAHGVGDREEVLLRGLVVGVLLPVLDARGRDGRDEGLLGAGARERGLEVLDVGLHVLPALVGDGPGADHVQGPHGRARHRPRAPRVELREGPHLSRSAPRATGRLRVRLEPGQPLVDVGNEARLAHLAVVDDVDAELGLLADDVRHRGPHPRRVAVLIVRPPGRLGLDHLEQVARAGQTARMGRENPVAAALHADASQPGSRTRSWFPSGRRRATASYPPSGSGPT